jgi:hypothetical protein
MLFGRKQAAGKTLLILDIESGSIGSALVHVPANAEAPALLGTWRKRLQVRHSRAAEALAADIEKAAPEAVLAMSELAARLRVEGQPALGTVSGVAAFLSPPWGRPNLESGRPDFVPHLQQIVEREVSPYFEPRPQFFTSAGAAAHALKAVSPYENSYLLVIVTHEITELVLVHNGAVAGHATVPHGISLPLRTLKSHAGLSDRESRAALEALLHEEALASATEHYGEEFRGAARELFDAHIPQSVWVISPAGDYFARALSHEHLADLFPQGGVVRPLRTQHAAQHLSGVSPQDDLFLVLEALFLSYTN